MFVVLFLSYDMHNLNVDSIDKKYELHVFRKEKEKAFLKAIVFFRKEKEKAFLKANILKGIITITSDKHAFGYM